MFHEPRFQPSPLCHDNEHWGGAGWWWWWWWQRRDNTLQRNARVLAPLFKCLSEILFVHVKRLIVAAAVVMRTLLIGSLPSLCQSPSRKQYVDIC